MARGNAPVGWKLAQFGPSQSHSRGSDDPFVKHEIRLEAPIGEATFYGAISNGEFVY